MTDADHEYQKNLVPDLVYDAIIARPQPVDSLVELPYPLRTRILRQGVDTAADPPPVG